MILFVDDEKREMESYRMELELELPDSGVVFKRNIDDALSFFEDNQNQIELLILDIMMPQGKAFESAPDNGLKTGIHFYRKVRTITPAMPIIIFTNISDENIEKAFSNDEKCWLMKKENYYADELVEKVKEILALQ